MGSPVRPFGSRLLSVEEGEAQETGEQLLSLATDFYSPVDPVRQQLGVELRGLGERLAGLDEQVLRPLAERLEKLGEAGRTAPQTLQTAEEIRRLARDLTELGDRLGQLATHASELGAGLRPLAERTERMGRRMTDLGARVKVVGDRLVGMRPEELSFLSSLAPARKVGGIPARSGVPIASTSALR